MDPMMATIMMFGGTFAPRQWAFCEGQLISIASNNALFALLGTTWGGDGRTTFALPDMRGRAPVGTGAGPGLTPRREGQTGGRETVTLTQAEMPVHNHAAQVDVKASDQPGSQYTPTANGYLAASNFKSGVATTEVNTYLPSSGGGNLQTLAGTTATIGNAGGGQSHENMQPFLVVPFIIAVQGLFPQRN